MGRLIALTGNNAVLPKSRFRPLFYNPFHEFHSAQL